MRLRALVLIRWAAVAGQLFTAAVVHWGLGFTLPVLAVGGAIALSALLNLTVSLGRPASARIDDREATVFLAFDILQLAVLLYLTGGLVNPFVLLLLAPVAIGATILSLASNIALSLLTIASIALLGIFHQPLPWRGPPPDLPEIYRAGVWAGLTLTTLLITLYGWRLAEEARQMADALAAAQAALAREQRLSALGALAAAAAHELGSPLSTIAVVTKEMLREVEPDDPLREDVELLSAESDRCRAILARLSVDPAGDVSDAYTLVPLPALIEAAAQNYKRDGIAIIFEAGPVGEGAPTTAPIQVRSPEIMQGIGNIVQNAVSFARHEIHISHPLDDRMVRGRGLRRRPGLLAGAARRTGHALHFDAPGRGRTHGIGRFHRQDAIGTHRRHRDFRQPPGRERRRGGFRALAKPGLQGYIAADVEGAP